MRFDGAVAIGATAFFFDHDAPGIAPWRILQDMHHERAAMIGQ
jgi:hypothetical protein